MAKRFGEIFQEVDRDLEGFGIKSYRIQNMTLEQVFLTIGEEEIKQDMKDDEETDAIKNDEIEMIDELP